MIRVSYSELDLGDLLRTLEAGCKSAILSVTCKELLGRIHLREGKLAYVHTSPGPHLGEYLVRFEYLTLEQVQDLVAMQSRENPGTPLGYLALQKQYITEDELQDVLHSQILEALATLLKQSEGEIVAEPLPVDASQVVLPGVAETSTMLIEALRRIDEWTRGNVSPEAVLQLVGDPTRHALSADAWSVLERVDGLKRARSIALECDLPEDQVYHLLFELISRGLLTESEIRPHDPLILVLAESMLVRRLLLISLERARYRVLLPHDIDSTKRMLSHHRPQGVVLEVDDLSPIAKQLRSTPEGRYIPIWGISEQPLNGFFVRGLRVGHIPKPFTEESLLEELSVIKRAVS